MMTGGFFFKKSVVLFPELEIALGMVADGADVGSLGSDHEMSAVAALPYLNAALFKYLLTLDIVEQRAVSVLMGLLDGRHAAESRRESREALLLGVLGHMVVHIAPLVVLALGGVEEVLRRVTQAAQLLEPELGVFLFIVGCLQEYLGYLLKARLFRDGCKIGVLVSGL